MNPAQIDITQLRSFDVETPKIESGVLAPRVIVGSAAEITPEGFPRGELLHPGSAAVARAVQYLEEGRILVGANIAYDLGCLCAARNSIDFIKLVVRRIREGKVLDVLIIQALDAIFGGHLGRDPRHGGGLINPATGKKVDTYGLATVLELTTGRSDAKASADWVTSYALLEHVPLEHWPRASKQYPVDDTVNALVTVVAQLRGWERGRLEPNERGPARNFNNIEFQMESAFWLGLGAIHGLRTDGTAVAALTEVVEKQYAEGLKRWRAKGWVRHDEHCQWTLESKDIVECTCTSLDGSEDTAAIKRAIIIAYGADVEKKCPRCAGTGRVRRVEMIDCRGEKLKGRYRGCVGAACVECAGKGKVGKAGNEVTCVVKEGGCDGTGVDLRADGLSKKLKWSKSGAISTDRDVKMESGDEDLSDFGVDAVGKLRTTYLPYLRRGVDRPITLKPNVLLETGRVSYRDPIQQFPRKKGPRQCIVPRPGHWLSSTDYAAGELCTLSQGCIWIAGYSEMARIINETKDPGSLHALLAAKMMGESFESVRALVKAGNERAKAYRQASKAGNFGFGGAMGPATFVLQKRKLAEGFTHHPEGPTTDADGRRGFNGIRFCLLIGGADYCGKEKITEWKGRQYAPMCKACVHAVHDILRPAFFTLYPEVQKLHDWVKVQIKKSPTTNEFGDQVGRIPCIVFNKSTGKPEVVRWRGGCNLTAGANNIFQALLSDIGKTAYNRASYECYTGEKWDGSGPSDLGGVRLPAWFHDDPLGEHPIPIAHLSGIRLADVLMEAGRDLAPDVHWKAETAFMERLDKDAEPVYVDGKLTLWKPKEKAAA